MAARTGAPYSRGSCNRSPEAVLLRLILILCGLAAGIAGLAADHLAVFPAVMTVSASNPVPRSLLGALSYFWSYFTHLSNLWLLLIYAASLVSWRWLGWFRQPATLASAAAFITLVMLFYHFVLLPTVRLEGLLAVGSILLHYVAPLIYLAWWTVAAPHGALRLKHLPVMLLPGVAYLAWVLGRGAVVNEYPYDILDAGRFGYGHVATGVATLMAGILVFSVILLVIDGWLGRRSAGNPGRG